MMTLPNLKKYSFLLCLLGVGACTYNYLPPIPASNIAPRPVRATLSSASKLSFENQRLELQVVVLELPFATPDEGGWLEIQFFDPFGTEIGSAAKYLSLEDIDQVMYLYPPNTEVTNGTYRAIASFGGAILRQFSVDIVF